MMEPTAQLPFFEALKSTARHIRILRSIHLAPVTIFAISQAPVKNLDAVALTVLVMHAFVYPSAAGFNSFHDRDTVATGGLKNPPPVHISLLWVVTLLDIGGVALAATFSPVFAVLVFGCAVASRLYSHRRVRIKARPIGGYLFVVLFQGAYVYVACYLGALEARFDNVMALLTPDLILPATFCSLLVAGSFPLSQIYQFKEDAERGDTTIAMLLGYERTFLVSIASLSVGYVIMLIYFIGRGDWLPLILTAVLFAPSCVLVVWWFLQVRKDHAAANHDNAMLFGATAGVCGNVCFAIIAYLNLAG